MFGLGIGEIALLGIIGLLVLGPNELPKVAKVAGRIVHDLRKALREVTSSMTEEAVSEFRKSGTEKKQPSIVEREVEKILETVQREPADGKK